MRPSALVVGIFVTAFVSACALLGQWLPFPEVGIVKGKIEHLARHGDEYDLIFLGSSRVHEQIIPAIFDQVATSNGTPVKSFNAGIVGMRSPEDGYVLKEILSRPHRRLRWVFLEISRLDTQVWEGHTARFGYWHDGTRLVLVARGLCNEALAGQSRLQRERKATFSARWSIWSTMLRGLSAHAYQWLIRGINLSRGSDVLSRLLRLPGFHFDVGKELGTRGDGWYPAPSQIQEMPAKFRADYDRSYADRLASPATKDRGDSVSQSALERMMSAVTEAGARPVIIIPPTTFEGNFYPTADREREWTILDYSDVRQYADLFVREHRRDRGHLNTAGAEIFTQILARRFAELAKARTQAH